MKDNSTHYIELYHGSLTRVDRPLVAVGRKDLDFGQGFYMTDIRTQAESWAQVLSERSKTPVTPILNIYSYDISCEVNYKMLTFPKYDKDWLDFICSSRRGEQPWKGYDIIKGGIANDSVIDTVDAYMSGLIDAASALGRLTYHKPNNQICILNQSIIDNYLSFVKCETVKR